MKTAACEPLGGNKVRKLELVAAEALATGLIRSLP
jgi:1-aminocyclopropane-1-carboxylate deaminase/D-cysteine desulfhydrase-like pyridoxal-dependent ACC family enzyme